MKRLVIASTVVLLFSCVNNRTDGMYEGPVVNANCALEALPPEKTTAIKELAIDTGKKDPLVRDGGMNVCRTF